jgi:hypothetical protein
MGIVTFSIPKGLVQRIIKQIPFDNFVETGTFEGNSSFWAAGHFKKVFTIEIDPAMSKATASKPDCPKNIEFLVGDSKDILPQLAKKLSGRSFFWLDGHWCGGLKTDDECPLMKEIEAIGEIKDAAIFIDDARCFLGPPPSEHDPKHWPRIDDIFQKLRELFPANFTTIQDDVIMSVPPDVARIVNEDWKEKYIARFIPDPPIPLSKLQLLKRLIFIRQRPFFLVEFKKSTPTRPL